MTGLIIFCVAALVLSSILTALVRQYASYLNLVDIPNHRSSHVKPTPRGGGLGFVVFFLFALPLMAAYGLLSFENLLLVGVSGLVIGLIGFIDDCFSMSARVRLVLQLGIAVFIVSRLGGQFELSFLHWSISSGVFLDGVLVIYLVWLLNLYNFMDGIDGLASLEAVTVCLGMSVLYWWHGAYELLVLPMVLGFGVLGFLMWNFPPAKIFMGDVGSGFLGLIIGIFSIQGGLDNSEYFWSWLILLGVFIVDATVTLLRRFMTGQAVMQAHRTHAYQQAVKMYHSHLRVSLGCGLINLVWLFPWAMLVGLGYIQGGIGLIMAYIPLLLLALKFKAGSVLPVIGHGSD